MEQSNSLLKIISYNIHSGKNLYMLPQLNKVIGFLKNQRPHIIGIQEINENYLRGHQVSKVKNILKMNHHFGPNVKIGGGHYGVGSFTPFEILEKTLSPLPSEKEQRGLLHTVVKVDNKELHLFNTHLGLGHQERIKQLKAIEDYLSSIKDPYILMGDFNSPTISFQHTDLKDAGKTMNQEDKATIRPYQKRIDYIFVSPSIEVLDYKVYYENMSDHYPVMAQIRLSP